MGFQGSVESFSLADVFQNLAMNSQTGTLRIWVPDGPLRHIFFESGQVKSVSHGEDQPILNARMLVGRSEITKEQAEEGLAKQKETGKSLANALIELGHLDANRVADLLRHQIEEEIYELFSWEKAQFEFVDGTPASNLFIDTRAAGGPSLPISSLIMEAARRVDEWDRLKAQITNFTEVLKVDDNVREAVASGALELDNVEKRVINLVDGKRDIEDIIADSFLFRFEVLQALAGFLQSSLVRPATAKELRQAVDELKAAQAKEKTAKVLERLLAIGGDNNEVRAMLAEALEVIEQYDKASIHFSVLADAKHKVGDEEAALNLYRRILQNLPNHLPSRERLGAIYARRGQVRESLIQYQEIIHACLAEEQTAEARAAARRALEVEPSNVEIRRELIQILLNDGDRPAAARELETLGDHLAQQSQTREAADCYRRALQTNTSLTHLKKKLANVMLTAEDRRARTQRTMIISAALGVAVIVAIVGAVREIKLYSTYHQSVSESEALMLEAKGLESRLQFQQAADKYVEAAQVFRRKELVETFSPFTGVGAAAAEKVKQYQDLAAVAMENFEKMADQGLTDSKLDFEDAEKLWKEDNIFAAQQKLKAVLENPFAGPDLKSKAQKLKDEVDERVNDFNAGMARVQKPPADAFDDVAAEYNFKDAFLRTYRRVPELKVDEIKLPVRVIPKNVDGVLVRLDGKFMGPASKKGTVFRYSQSDVHEFEFVKDGYRPLKRRTADMGPVLVLVMEREPSKTIDLTTDLSGSPVYDGQYLWVGASDGGLIQINPDPAAMEEKWRFRFPGQGGLLHEPYGQLVARTEPGKPTQILYVTRGGDCLVVESGKSAPVRFIESKWRTGLSAPPRIEKLKMIGDQLFFLLPAGRRLFAFSVENGTPLWSSGSEELPQDISSAPVILDAEQMIVVGCRDGDLYGFDARNGRMVNKWKGGGATITGYPIIEDKHLIAGNSSGNLFFFEAKSQGVRVQNIDLRGSIEGRMAVQRKLLFVGTTNGDGFHGVDLDLLSRKFSFVGDQINGGVTTGPTVVGDRMYFGTRTGYLYAFRREGANYQIAWSYRTKGQQRNVGAPVVVRDRVFFALADGKIYIFED